MKPFDLGLIALCFVIVVLGVRYLASTRRPGHKPAKSKPVGQHRAPRRWAR